MLARFTLFLMASLVLLATGCGGPTVTELATHKLDLSGYAYSGDLFHMDDARLEMQLTLVEQIRGRNEQPLVHLLGEGALTVGDQVYTVRFGPDSGPFLSERHSPCYDYYLGGSQAAYDGDTRLELNLEISEDFQHAKGIISLDGPWPTYSHGASAICFDEEGQRGFEIYSISFEDDEGEMVPVGDRVLILNLGPDISPLEKLRAERDKRPDER